jgi:hypothetical protein
MAPVPLLWDRWRLAPGWSPRLQLVDLLLASRATGAPLMLDLKGGDRRLATELVRLIDEFVPDRLLSVCSRNWTLLDPFADAPRIRVVHSVGSRAQLRALLSRRYTPAENAVSVHQRLLSPGRVRTLRRRAALLMTWPVNTVPRMEELVSWGVTGIISDAPRVLRELIRRRAGLIETRAPAAGHASQPQL